MNVRQTLSIFFRHLAPERGRIAVHLPCVLANGAMASLPPFLAGVFVNQLIRHPQHAAFGATSAIEAVAIVGIVSTILHFTRGYLSTLICERVGCRFQCALYEHLQRLSADFYQINRVGELTTRLTHDVNDGIRPLYSQAAELLNGGAMLIVAAACLAYVSVPLFWIFSLLTFLSLAVSQWALPIIIRNFEEMQNVNGRLNAQITEAVSVHSLVRAFAREDEAQRRMQPLIEERSNHQIKAFRFLWRFMVFVWSFDIVSGPFLLLLLGALLYGRGITAGSLVSALLYWRMAGHYKFQVTEGITGVMSGLGSVRRAAAFFEETPLVADLPNAPALPPGLGSIEFDDVTFHYPHQRDEFVLGPISLSIPAGTRYALLGPSGGGKTTLVQLLGRIYDPGTGAIRIDGHDIRSVTQLSLRQRIGFMSQETQLFDGTLRDNLLFAAPQAAEAILQESMARAGLADFLASLPESLETVVGERGIRLSGGQRQRLALARLLLLDPEIVVLDEPTSALDAATEAEIWTSIEELLRGRTQIVITHRISTALRAEQLAVIHHGRLDGAGTAEELTRESALFRALCAAQKTAAEGGS